MKSHIPALFLLLTACTAPPYAAYAIEDDAEEIAQVVENVGRTVDRLSIGHGGPLGRKKALAAA